MGEHATVVRSVVAVHGTRISYLEAGPAGGPLILMIHGVASQAATWEPAMTFLAEGGLHVLAPDLPGHGASEPGHGDYSLGAFATVLRDLVLTLGLGPATLVGHSLGGGIALQLGHQFPELSQRLVLVASGGLGADAHPLLRAASAPGAELVLPLVMNRRVAWAMNRARRALESRGRTPELLSDGALRNYASLSTPQGRRIFLATVRSVINYSGQRVSAVGRLHLTGHLPTLLVSCEHDPAIPRAHAEAAHAELPNSRLEILPGRSHRPHQHVPEQFAAVLVDFVRTTEPATGPPAWRLSD